MWLFYLIGAYFAILGVVGLFHLIMKIPADLQERKRIDDLAREIEQREIALKSDRERFVAGKAEAVIALETIGKEKALGFPWLATAYSDYFKLFDLKLANELETKERPARRAAEDIRAMAAEKAGLRRENRILRDLHRYYENLFPWLIDFKGDDLDEMIRQVNQPKVDGEPNDDPAMEWLSDAERDSATLTRAEKFQRALDRYWQSKKTPWQIGRDYERYIGYVHEQNGFRVEYHGIDRGYDDLGRDLICTKGNDVRIIQCKYWGAHRTLHEKHVCQIYGTAEAYRRKCDGQGDLFGEREITAWLYVSCPPSPTAKEFAEDLGVYLKAEYPLSAYPVIKCNVSLRDGSKIYHLPFDQQYDRTLIEHENECYVQTVAEAEALGFRRAYRWQGNRQPHG